MREYFYFIENDRNEWHWVNKRPKNTEERHPLDFDDTIYHYDEWTKDPLEAMRFTSIERAESYIVAFSKKEKLMPYVITQHEFVVNKV